MEKRTRIYDQSEKGVVSFCQYHLVWCTCFRRPILSEEIRDLLKGEIQDICRETDIRLRRILLYPDWIGLTVEVSPETPPSRIVHRIRTHCAGLLKRRYPELNSRVASIFTLDYFVTTQEEFPEHAVAVWIRSRPRWSKPKKQKAREYAHVKRIRLE